MVVRSCNPRSKLAIVHKRVRKFGTGDFLFEFSHILCVSSESIVRRILSGTNPIICWLEPCRNRGEIHQSTKDNFGINVFFYVEMKAISWAKSFKWIQRNLLSISLFPEKMSSGKLGQWSNFRWWTWYRSFCFSLVMTTKVLNGFESLNPFIGTCSRILIAKLRPSGTAYLR